MQRLIDRDTSQITRVSNQEISSDGYDLIAIIHGEMHALD